MMGEASDRNEDWAIVHLSGRSVYTSKIPECNPERHFSVGWAQVGRIIGGILHGTMQPVSRFAGFLGLWSWETPSAGDLQNIRASVDRVWWDTPPTALFISVFLQFPYIGAAIGPSLGSVNAQEHLRSSLMNDGMLAKRSHICIAAGWLALLRLACKAPQPRHVERRTDALAGLRSKLSLEHNHAEFVGASKELHVVERQHETVGITAKVALLRRHVVEHTLIFVAEAVMAVDPGLEVARLVDVPDGELEDLFSVPLSRDVPPENRLAGLGSPPYW
ncbi:hypothetical protein SCUP234_03970 [Seiridium cupressi]